MQNKRCKINDAQTVDDNKEKDKCSYLYNYTKIDKILTSLNKTEITKKLKLLQSKHSVLFKYFLIIFFLIAKIGNFGFLKPH